VAGLGIAEIIGPVLDKRNCDFDVERALFEMVTNCALAPASTLHCRESWLVDYVRIEGMRELRMRHLYRTINFLEASKKSSGRSTSAWWICSHSIRVARVRLPRASLARVLARPAAEKHPSTLVYLPRTSWLTPNGFNGTVLHPLCGLRTSVLTAGSSAGRLRRTSPCLLECPAGRFSLRDINCYDSA
jgi:hypothetical protein